MPARGLLPARRTFKLCSNLNYQGARTLGRKTFGRETLDRQTFDRQDL